MSPLHGELHGGVLLLGAAGSGDGDGVGFAGAAGKGESAAARDGGDCAQ